MFDDSKKVDILLKAWDQAQAIARSCEDSATKTRAFGLAIWSGLLAYGYTTHDGFVHVVAFITLILSCVGEMGVRQIQYSFIQRSFEIERCLDAFMVNDYANFISADISTHIPAPNFRRFVGLFNKRRWLSWGPYAIAATFTVVGYVFLRLRS